MTRSICFETFGNHSCIGLDNLFEQHDRVPWCIFSKMHDSTKQLLLLPPDTVVFSKGAAVAIGGPQVVNLFVQEDKIITKDVAEVCLHSPIHLDTENGLTVFKATTGAGDIGGGGDGLKRVLKALKDKKLSKAIILDVADMGGPNLVNHRLWESLIEDHDVECKVMDLDDTWCLLLLQRCEGHQLHLVAMVCVRRSGISAPLYSSALLLRQGSFKLNLHTALARLVASELVFTQGGGVKEEDQAYAREILRRTLFGGLEENAQDKKSKETKELCERALKLLNQCWAVLCLTHTCILVPDLNTGGSKWCCPNRHCCCCSC